jgi:N12 class adenine-specific DNA methylase
MPLLCSIEKYNKHTETYDKEAIFTKATIKSYKRPSTADNVIDALMLSINYYQKVNLQYIAGLCGRTPDEVIDELGNKIYLNPLNYYGNKYEGWEIDEEYLSGNVKNKLEYVTLKAQENPELFNRNVEALKAVQPEPLKPSDISFRIGTKWIPIEYYQKFMHETFGTNDRYYLTLEYNKFTGAWWINNKMSEKGNTLVNQTFGTSRMNAYEIYEASLNLQNVVVRDSIKETNAEGKEVTRYVTNPQQTAIAREKQEQIREKFSTWLFSDKDRANIIVNIYNDRYNVYRPRTYDGSYLNISGLNEEYSLMKHQLDFVARAAHTGSALNGHVVGGGKTLSLIASGMYMKEIGSIKKPVFVVPNNIIGQWANDFYRFFPAANILVTTENDFSKKNRQKFISKIAMGEYDAVLITQSQFEKIPVSLQRQMDMARAQIDEINWAVAEAKKRGGSDWTIKDMERLAYNLEIRIAKLAANWKKDEIIDFEQLGIDFMFVDEAHNYKNGFIYSKIRGDAGVGRSASQRAMDMLQKCQYLQETYNGRGAVMATGTPISNSLSEL